MVGIVVVGHGRIGEEALRTVETVMGPIDAFEAVTTATGVRVLVRHRDVER